MEWINHHQLRLKRLGSYFAVLGALVWFLWPSNTWSIDTGALSTLVGTMVVWGWQEIISFRASRTQHPHDIRLMKEVRETVGTPQLRFLRGHDFYNDFSSEEFSFLNKIAESWEGVSYEFHDPRIEKVFQCFVTLATEFAIEKSRQTIPVNGGLLSIRTEVDRAGHEVTPQTRAAIDDLNSRAIILADKYEGFERIARALLPNAFVA